MVTHTWVIVFPLHSGGADDCGSALCQQIAPRQELTSFDTGTKYRARRAAKLGPKQHLQGRVVRPIRERVTQLVPSRFHESQEMDVFIIFWTCRLKVRVCENCFFFACSYKARLSTLIRFAFQRQRRLMPNLLQQSKAIMISSRTHDHGVTMSLSEGVQLF